MTEAERLSDMYDEDVDTNEEQLEERILKLKAAYNRARTAKVGTDIVCPTCGRVHLKTTYHKVFCNNQKTKRKAGRRKQQSCKDEYWNLVDDTRRYRAQIEAELKRK